MAKRVSVRPHWLKVPYILDIYSVGSSAGGNFADYLAFKKHNGYLLFDSPQMIRALAMKNSFSLDGTSLFYYEAHEMEFDGEEWQSFSADPSLTTKVIAPSSKVLEGFDVVTAPKGKAPEYSPLSCNGLAEDIPTNTHCLFDSFGKAESSLNTGRFNGCELGPYRIFAVYSVDWPKVDDLVA